MSVTVRRPPSGPSHAGDAPAPKARGPAASQVQKSTSAAGNLALTDALETPKASNAAGVDRRAPSERAQRRTLLGRESSAGGAITLPFPE